MIRTFLLASAFLAAPALTSPPVLTLGHPRKATPALSNKRLGCHCHACHGTVIPHASDPSPKTLRRRARLLARRTG